eukprot:TRINITY_DN2731_c0_g1_i1.p1 TRINITY_DN2731_c0_g1~~TRINITY_DN2731_c0_g1_i1.p1  ORF type:complete len:523 (+),score=188.65 TRINITY_DN2731_c0_g1_i1:35-1570(+)
MTNLDTKIAELAEKYTPLAAEILREAIRIPADTYDENLSGGMSNNEGPRLEYLKKRIVEVGAVASAEDVWFDDFGNLIWKVMNPNDGIEPEKRRVVWFDGHTDTVDPLRAQWQKKIGGGIDCFNGLVDPEKVDQEFLRSQLGYLPPKEEWDQLIFGRGSADQLAGVIDQIIATKICLELIEEGALDGVVIYSIGTIAEEDNDGGGPMFIIRNDLPNHPEMVPDVVIMTEGTGETNLGALGIYRGQRGRMQIEVEVVGQSAHGSMPHMGKNPLEFGARIIAEACDKFNEKIGILDHEFLSQGTRTASWCKIDTPSDCAVPDRFVFRFDRRMTVGESPEFCLQHIEQLDSVKFARENGCQVNISVPRYNLNSWRGVPADNDQIYLGWVTPEEHPSIQVAVDAYKRMISPHLEDCMNRDITGKTYHIPKEPRVDRWIFSTDGVGYPIPKDQKEVKVTDYKRWVQSGDFIHPAMLGIGAGCEHNTHKIGEFVDMREMRHTIAFMARYPSLFVSQQ